MNNLIGISGKIGSGKDEVGIVLQYLTCLKLNVLAEHQKDYNDFRLLKVSNELQSGYQIKKFADKTTKAFELITGVNYHKLSREDKESIRPQYVEFAEKQKEIFDEDVWVNALFADYTPRVLWGRRSTLMSELPNWIITDVRFPNEAQAIIDRGGIVIRVGRDSWKPKAGDTIKIKVFSNWSIVTYTHTDEEGNHHGVGADGYKYKSTLIKEHKEEHPSETALDDYEFDHVIENDGSLEELIEKVKQLKLV